MFNIEIIPPRKGVVRGSSILDLYMRKGTPIIDLLVRESIQNSLDAYIEKTDFVHVQYIYNKFDTNSLISGLEGLQGLKKYSKYSNYLAIRDTNTTGLEGEIDEELAISKLDDASIQQRFYKLVYGILEPASDPVAGGNAGVGKTLYFSVGKGLIFYYSRIKTGEHRLVGAFVENPSDEEKKIITTSTVGVAFLGETNSKDNSRIRAITNVSKIKEFLDIFGLDLYPDGKTGTMVIIPFVDEKELRMANNVEFNNKELYNRRPWMWNLKDYISELVKRWYFPRLSNRTYYTINALPRLEVNYNNEYISLTKDGKILPVYQELQNLYNETLKNPQEIIEYKKKTLGYFKIKEYEYKQLSLRDIPISPSIYDYCKVDHDEDKNTPILMMVRKPGMIVSYHSGLDDWCPSVIVPNNKISICMFIANSKDIELEKYLRKSEMSDHSNWEDHSKKGFEEISLWKPISKIKWHVKKLIKQNYPQIEGKEGTSIVTSKSAIGLSRIISKAILPDRGFGIATTGKLSTIHGAKKKSPIKTSPPKKHNFFDYDVEFKFNSESNKTNIIYRINAKKSFELDYFIELDQEEKVSDWVVEGFKAPIIIENAKFLGYTKDSDGYHNLFEEDYRDKPIDNDYVKIESLLLPNEQGIYGFKVDKINKAEININVTYTIKILDNSMSVRFSGREI